MELFGGLLIGLLAVFALYIVLKLLAVSVPTIMKLVWNGVVGLVILFLFNLIGGNFGLALEMNVLNSLIAGVFGVPGIIILLLLQ